MFAHVTIRVADAAASARFYTTVLAALDIAPGPSGADWKEFSIAQADDGAPVTRRLHIGFVAGSRAHVDAFWRAGIAGGHRDDGAPGPRPQYRHDYYGAFLLDPDGNSAEAVHHGALRAGDVIDHLWMRVSDMAAATRFYETIAPHAGLSLDASSDEHAWFRGSSGSFTLVAGAPTRHLHMAYPAGDDETVDALHEAALNAGFRDGGPPAGRSLHGHTGYAASVLDPDANRIEIVSCTTA